MKPLLKVLFIIFICFAATFILIKATGVLTLEQIESWLIQAKELSPIYVIMIVVVLLFSDLFIAIPTLTVTILAGYFLGHMMGAFSAFMGMTMAGICGYLLSHYFGETILGFLVKDEVKRQEAIEAFNRHGFVMILLSRAIPIMPEASACLAGMTKMPFKKFILAWLLSTVPYILIATYAGSISSLHDPKPALFTALGLSAFLWAAWYLYHRKQKRVYR